ncbi:MAG: hypothetical protein ACTSRP_04110 [Candidatus Helarchaeota archaeon]
MELFCADTGLGCLIMNHEENDTYSIILEFCSKIQEALGIKFMMFNIEDFKFYLNILTLIQRRFNFDFIMFQCENNTILFKKHFQTFEASKKFYDETLSVIKSIEKINTNNKLCSLDFLFSSLWWTI